MKSAFDAPAEKDAAVPTGNSRLGKYLVFHLGSEEFGIQVLKVREIIGIQGITVVPKMPDYVKGVINLRGKMIPVVNLRLKFGMAEAEHTQRTCIIVVQLHGSTNPRLMGVIVDGVAEVLNLAAGDIEDTPDFGPGVTTPYLLGMAKMKDKVKILLDIDEAMSSQELHGLKALLD